MNERIKELYLQAHSIRRYDGDPMREGNPPTVYWQGEVSAQRFAELIVRECMDCAEWVGKVNTTPVEPINTAYAFKKRIKQHFGVDE